MKDIPESHHFQGSAATYVAAFAGVAGFLSIVGNGIALYLINHTRFNFRKFNKHMTIIAAVGDIVSSTTALMMGIPYAVLRYPGIYLSEWYCNAFQSILNFSTIVSWTAVGLIAVDRFLSVFTPHTVHSAPGWIILIVVSLTFLSFDIANIFAGKFIPDPTDSHCWYDNAYSSISYTSTIITSIVFTFCFIIISITYISVSIYCYKKWRETGSKSLKHAFIRCVFIMSLYYIALAPKVISTLWSFFSLDTHPFVLHIITPIGLAFSMVVNPMLVLGLHARNRAQLTSFMPSHKS